jgi:hypothetical protein
MIRNHPDAYELLKFMVQLSGRFYRGGWGQGFEYILYEATLTGPLSINGYHLDGMDIDQASLLSRRCNGWWTKLPSGDFQFIRLQTWHDNFIIQPSIF